MAPCPWALHTMQLLGYNPDENRRGWMNMRKIVAASIFRIPPV